MYKLLLAALISGGLLFTGYASAQSVLFPTGNFAYTVDISYPSSGAAATPTPGPGAASNAAQVRKAKKVGVAQVGNVKAIQIIWTSGPPTEEWTVPNLPVVFKEYPDGQVDSVQKGSMENKWDNFNIPYDAPAFSWVNPGCLQEQEPISFQGKQCYHYKGATALPVVSARKAGGPPVLSAQEAWIDSKTLLPVALNTDKFYCIFTFQDTPPAGPLVPPKKFQEAITYYKWVMGYP